MSTANDQSELKQARLVVIIPDEGKGRITKELLIAELVNEGILADVKDGDWTVNALANGEAEVFVNYRD